MLLLPGWSSAPIRRAGRVQGSDTPEPLLQSHRRPRCTCCSNPMLCPVLTQLFTRVCRYDTPSHTMLTPTNNHTPFSAWKRASNRDPQPSTLNLLLASAFRRLPGVEHLASVLANCTQLAHLNLSANSLGQNGASAVARALECSQTLTHLDFAGNAFGDQSPHAVLLFIAAVRPCVLEKILCASAGAVSACSPRAVSAGSAAILEITRAARPFFSGK
eukprot:2483351-Rhodomonas_salina.1